jgi:hypothetical protein
LNHPFFPRNQLAVWVGPGGINTKDQRPITNVMTAYAELASVLSVPSVRAYLDQKKPSPTGEAMNSSHLQQSSTEQRGNNISDRQSRPEEPETNREFVMLVEIR